MPPPRRSRRGPDGNVWFTEANYAYNPTMAGGAVGVATTSTQLKTVVTTQPPASVSTGSGFGITVEVENSSNAGHTNFNGDVTVTLANNPGGSTLGEPSSSRSNRAWRRSPA